MPNVWIYAHREQGRAQDQDHGRTETALLQRMLQEVHAGSATGRRFAAMIRGGSCVEPDATAETAAFDIRGSAFRLVGAVIKLTERVRLFFYATALSPHRCPN